MRGRWRGRRIALALLALFAAAEGLAHEVRPLLVRIDELASARYRLQVRVPNTIEPGNRPEVRLPEGCRPLGGEVWGCDGPLPGRQIDIRWPLYNPAVTTLFQFTAVGAPLLTQVMPPGGSRWTVPAEPGAVQVSQDYFSLGVMHILGGFDHLLFVLALLLIARDGRRILLAVTGFTISHSLSLSLAALGMIRVPVPPTEAVIALSLLFLAREAMLPESRTLVHRHPVLVSALFGLLHGLGFAAALGETGLPRSEIVWALLSFNVGVEVGQLAFILAVVSLYWLLNGLSSRGRDRELLDHRGALKVAGYLLGIPAAFWLFERL